MKFRLILGCGLTALSFCVCSQLTIPSRIIEPVTPIIDRIPTEINNIQDKLESHATRGIQGTADTLSAVSQPLFSVPAALTLSPASGGTAFVEVKAPDGYLAVKQEWVFLGSQQDKKFFLHPEITIESARYLQAMDKWLYRLKVSASLDKVSQISNSLPDNLKRQIGRNHIYFAQSASEKGSAYKQAASSKCMLPSRIGMIDTPIAAKHDAFVHLHIEQRSFLPQALPDSEIHGTAVASLLAQNMQADSQLFNASVFYTRNNISQGATLTSLIDGLDYLMAQKVDAINMSLAGPANPVLEQAVASINAKGIQIFAAAGNEGPAAPPMFPAAYSSSIAVSAVAENHSIYRWANQGEYIDFAARGVSVVTAHPTELAMRESGTSMATPIVTTRYACLLRNLHSRAKAIDALRKEAIDAGQPGKDPVFGFGIIQK